MQGARFYTCKEPDDRSSSRDGRENSAEEEPSALLGNKSSKSTALVHQHHVRDSKQTNMSGVSAGHCHIVTGNEKNFKPVAQYKTAKEVMDDPAVQEQRKNRIDVLMNNKNGKKKLHVDFVLDDELVQFIRENAVWEKEMLASNKTKTKTNGNKNRELLANKDPIVRLSLALDFWGYEIDLEFQPDGDGSCLYRAIAELVYDWPDFWSKVPQSKKNTREEHRLQDLYYSLRQLVATYYQHNRAYYESLGLFPALGTTLDEHCRKVADETNHEWADEHDILALGEALGLEKITIMHDKGKEPRVYNLGTNNLVTRPPRETIQKYLPVDPDSMPRKIVIANYGEVHYVLLRHVLPDSKPDLGNIVKRVAGKMKKKSAARGGATSSASGKKTGIKKSQSKVLPYGSHWRNSECSRRTPYVWYCFPARHSSRTHVVVAFSSNSILRKTVANAKLQNPSSKNGSSKGKKMATMKAPATKGKAAGTTNTTQSVKTKRKKQTGKKNSPSVQTTKKSSVQTTKKSSVQTSNKSSVAPKSSKGVKMGTGQKKKSSGGGKKPTGAAPKSTKKTGGNNTKKMNKMKSAKNVKKTDGKRKMQ
ncbi:unnamed protein product [Amoebophrya sp. A120]|nr:unnamed protein product [Amoebophrya sp. A120]|eukprot:GSA120T00020647001.1